ncbi:hypothetical protein QJQ45_028778 [Haematococcus lacustris]|nr:hypothetical protein QJQ45_028778 [Haematococcus lacustris]
MNSEAVDRLMVFTDKELQVFLHKVASEDVLGDCGLGDLFSGEGHFATSLPELSPGMLEFMPPPPAAPPPSLPLSCNPTGGYPGLALPSPTPSRPYKVNQDKPPVSHSTVEKQRRDRINALIDELRELVPPQKGGQVAPSNPGMSAKDAAAAAEARRPKHVVLADTIALLRQLHVSWVGGSGSLAAASHPGAPLHGCAGAHQTLASGHQGLHQSFGQPSQVPPVVTHKQQQQQLLLPQGLGQRASYSPTLQGLGSSPGPGTGFFCLGQGNSSAADCAAAAFDTPAPAFSAASTAPSPHARHPPGHSASVTLITPGPQPMQLGRQTSPPDPATSHSPQPADRPGAAGGWGGQLRLSGSGANVASGFDDLGPGQLLLPPASGSAFAPPSPLAPPNSMGQAHVSYPFSGTDQQQQQQQGGGGGAGCALRSGGLPGPEQPLKVELGGSPEGLAVGLPPASVSLSNSNNSSLDSPEEEMKDQAPTSLANCSAPQLPVVPVKPTALAGVVVDRGPADSLYVQVKCRDRKGLLSDIINALKNLPLEVRTAAVTTQPDGQVRDVFEIKLEDTNVQPEDVQNTVHEALFQQYAFAELGKRSRALNPRVSGVRARGLHAAAAGTVPGKGQGANCVCVAMANTNRPGDRQQLVVIEYERLTDSNADLHAQLQQACIVLDCSRRRNRQAVLPYTPQAYGPDGLGVLTISGVPNISDMRERLLRLASQVAALPAPALQRLEDVASQYNFGWSHGKEALQSGALDTHKGSFYANPMTDQPCAPDSPLLQQYPQYFRPNIWPGPDLPDLEPAFKALGQAVVALGTQLAHHCDRYCCALNPGLAPGQLLGVLSASCTHKGRLLHYFPQGQPDSPAEPCPAQPTASQEDVGQADGAGSGPWQEGGIRLTVNDAHGFTRKGPGVEAEQQQSTGAGAGVEAGEPGAGAGADVKAVDHEQAWCGWHTDHGSLTGLTSAMFMRGPHVVACPDPAAGLYIRNRRGQVVQVAIPADHIAFQVGEALQVHSGGLLCATPHYVRGARGPGTADLARNTFAVRPIPGSDHMSHMLLGALQVFMQPDVAVPMDTPKGVTDEQVAVGQWRRGQTFGDFSTATFEQYYTAHPKGTMATDGHVS